MARDGNSPLFSPGRIGPLHLENRVIMAPMTTRRADAEGFVTEDGLAYYGARAAGGVGLVTVEMAAPEPAGKHRRFELGISDDRFLPGLSRLVGLIHEQGAKASIQLGHGGGHTRRDICGEEPVAPSAIPHSVQEGHTEVIVPQAMSEARNAIPDGGLVINVVESFANIPISTPLPAVIDNADTVVVFGSFTDPQPPKAEALR